MYDRRPLRCFSLRDSDEYFAPVALFLLIISYMLQLIDGRLLNQAVTNLFCPRVYFSQEQLISKQSSPKVLFFFTKLRKNSFHHIMQFFFLLLIIQIVC